MSEVTGKGRETVTTTVTAIVQVALVVVAVVGVGWSLLKIAQWQQADARAGSGLKSRGTAAVSRPAGQAAFQAAGRMPAGQAAIQAAGEVETRMIVLTTPFALIHGEAKMVPRGENSYIDDWKRLDDRVEWRFDVKTPGEYEVVVEYATAHRPTLPKPRSNVSGNPHPNSPSNPRETNGRLADAAASA